MKKRAYDTALEILEYAVKNKMLITDAASVFNKYCKYVSNYRSRDFQKNYDSDLISFEEYQYFLSIYENYLSSKDRTKSKINKSLYKRAYDINLKILNFAKSENLSLKQACVDLGYGEQKIYNYMSKYNNSSIYKNLENGIITQEEYEEFLSLYEDVMHNNVLKNTDNHSEKLELQNQDNKETTEIWVDRDENDKIVRYNFSIFKKGFSKPLTGSFTREDIEYIYNNYEFQSRKELHQNLRFKDYTYADFERIINAFVIRKKDEFTPHDLEEKTAEELAQMRLHIKQARASQIVSRRENQAWKERAIELEKEKIAKEKEGEWLQSLVKEALNSVEIQPNNTYQDTSGAKGMSLNMTPDAHQNLYVFLGDIHFGKKTQQSRFNVGNSVDIISNRVVEVFRESASTFFYNKFSGNIYINILGDIFESLLPDGMHPGHAHEMDVYGAEQFKAALQSFIKGINVSLSYLRDDTKIFVKSIGGNHDRLGKTREHDRLRTAAGILFTALEAVFTGNERVNFSHQNEEILTYCNNDDNINVILFHGDHKLPKSNPVEIMNSFLPDHSLPDNFTIIVNGHWHNFKVNNEGMNYMGITAPSVCSSDDYIMKQLGKGAQPGYLMVWKPKNTFGVEVLRKALV